jgi:hypothetical protein
VKAFREEEGWAGLAFTLGNLRGFRGLLDVGPGCIVLSGGMARVTGVIKARIQARRTRLVVARIVAGDAARNTTEFWTGRWTVVGAVVTTNIRARNGLRIGARVTAVITGITTVPVGTELIIKTCQKRRFWRRGRHKGVSRSTEIRDDIGKHCFNSRGLLERRGRPLERGLQYGR